MESKSFNQLIELGYEREDILLAVKDANDRLSWKIDSICLVYSRSRFKWHEAKIVDVSGHSRNVLAVKYGRNLNDNKTTHNKKILRFDKYIKPIGFGRDYVYNQHLIQFVASKLIENDLNDDNHTNPTRNNELESDTEDDMNDQRVCKLFFSNKWFSKTGRWYLSGHKIEECPSIHRIRILLNMYKKNRNILSNIMNESEFEYDYIKLYDDYHHVLLQHASNLEDIMNFINNAHMIYNECNINECGYLLRIYSNRSNDKCDDNDDEKNENDIHYLQQRMDAIHVYIFHSFNLNYRLTLKQKKFVFNTNKEIFDDKFVFNKFDDEKVFDSRLEKLEQIRNKTLNNNYRITKNRGFITDNLGNPFKYWQHDKFNYWYIPSKYENLKTEMLSNKNMSISLNQFSSDLKQAMHFKETEFTKQVLSSSELMVLRKYGLKDEVISINHILSVLFFSNYTEISTLFSSTFTKSSSNELNEELIKRNSEYHHWSKYLYEAVICFGSKHKKGSSDNTWNELWPSDGVWYGINTDKLLFPAFKCTFYKPLSTTSNYQVAFNFADGNGMVLRLNHYKSSIRYFFCCALSDFSAENELLCFQEPLIIESITSIKLKENYEWFTKAMRSLLLMTKSQHRDKGLVHKKYLSYYNAMIDGKYAKYPDYTNKLFNNITQYIEDIDFNIWLWTLDSYGGSSSFAWPCGYSLVSDLFIYDATRNFIDFVKMIKLCRNVKQIRIYNFKEEGASYEIQPTVLLDDEFLSYLIESLYGESSYGESSVLLSSLKCVRILIYSPNEETMSISKFIEKYNEKMNDIEKPQYKLQHIIKEYPRRVNWKETMVDALCILHVNNVNNVDAFQCIEQDKFEQFVDILKYERNENKHFYQFLNEKRESDGMNLLLFICGYLKHDAHDLFPFLQHLLDNYCDEININETNNDGNTALMICALYNKCKYIKLLIEFVADLNGQNKDGNTALHIAAENNNLKMMKLLLLLHVNKKERKQASPNINVLNNENESIAYTASHMHHNIDMVNLLIEKGNYSNWSNDTNGLFIACVYGQIELIQTILKQNKDIEINKRPKRGDMETCLLVSCCLYSLLNDNKYLEIIKILIDNQNHEEDEYQSKWHREKLWMNMRDFRNRRTLVWYAAACKNRLLWDLIVKHKPDLNVPISGLHYEDTYYDTCTEERGIAYFDEKQQEKRATKWNNAFYQTSPLNIACYMENIEIIKYLLQHKEVTIIPQTKTYSKYNPIEFIKDGFNPFQIAAYKANIEILERIYEGLSKKYDEYKLKEIVNFKEEKTGFTAFHLVCRHKNDSYYLMIIYGFIRQYFDQYLIPNEINKLILLFHGNDIAMKALKYLVETVKVDITQKDENGKTGLEYAEQYKNNEIVSYLSNL